MLAIAYKLNETMLKESIFFFVENNLFFRSEHLAKLSKTHHLSTYIYGQKPFEDKMKYDYCRNKKGNQIALSNNH